MTVKRVGKSKAPPFPAAPAPLELPPLAPWSVKPGPAAHVQRVMDAIVAAGADGITAGGLKVETGLSVSEIDGAFAALALEPTPRIFWAGYDNAHVVAREFWGGWTTRIKPRDKFLSPDPSPRVECVARRWVEIWGELIPTEWDRGMKAVLGQLIVRPGMTEHDLRQRLGAVLDRMEVSDVLQALVGAGWVQRRTGLPSSRPVPPVHATDAWEARAIVLSTDENMWV
jgi:transcription factor C subunit 3